MDRRWKNALGVATVWPLVYLVLYFIFAFWVFLSTADGRGALDHVVTARTAANVLAALTVLLTVGLLVVYLVLIFRNPRLDGGMRMAWVIVVLAGNVAGMLVYWYLQINRQSQQELGVLGLGLRMAAGRKASAVDEDGIEDASGSADAPGTG